MTESATVTRPEIAKLLGVAASTLSNLLLYHNPSMPAPVGKRGNALVYDEAAIIAWVATKPLVGVCWRQSGGCVPTPSLDTDLVRLFLSGGVGSKMQLRRYRLRKLIAKHAPRPVRRVEVPGCDDYHGSRNPWTGLV